MPDDIAVGGDGDALIHEAELRIKADEPFLAGEHDALAPGGSRVGADLTQQAGSTALVPIAGAVTTLNIICHPPFGVWRWGSSYISSVRSGISVTKPLTKAFTPPPSSSSQKQSG